MTLVPATRTDDGTEKVLNTSSADPPTVELARVVEVIGPPGMLERATSTPFTYTTAPSSLSSDSSRASKAAGSATNDCRK